MSALVKRVIFVLSFAISLTFIVNSQNLKITEKNVEVGGYCPVSYIVMNKNVKGDPNYTTVYEGKTYYLANAKAKEMFDAEPQKYLPK